MKNDFRKFKMMVFFGGLTLFFFAVGAFTVIKNQYRAYQNKKKNEYIEFRIPTQKGHVYYMERKVEP